MLSINDFYNIDINQLNQDTLRKLGVLSRTIFGKEIKDLDLENLGNLILVDMGTLQNSYTISASETRKTEVQYCTNNYTVSTVLDCSGILKSMTSIVESASSIEEALNRYYNLKSVFFSVMKEKLSTNEHYLRQCIREFEEKDKIAGQGRFTS